MPLLNASTNPTIYVVLGRWDSGGGHGEGPNETSLQVTGYWTSPDLARNYAEQTKKDSWGYYYEIVELNELWH